MGERVRERFVLERLNSQLRKKKDRGGWLGGGGCAVGRGYRKKRKRAERSRKLRDVGRLLVRVEERPVHSFVSSRRKLGRQDRESRKKSD